MLDKKGLIIEGLKNRSKSVSSWWKTDSGYAMHGEEVEWELLWHERSLLNEGVDNISEGSVVTFGKQTNPESGWAVILAGGPGSGKGYILGNQVMIDAKVIDVDKLKELYAAWSKKSGGKVYDFKNPDHVGDLHKLIADKGWKDSIKNMFFDANDKPINIVFDITGKTAESLTDTAEDCKSLGYKVAIVWVVANREVAMMRNLMRKRVVGEDMFHMIHNALRANMLQYLVSSSAGKCVDEAWIVFSGEASIVDKEAPKSTKDLKDTVYKLDKKGGKFEVTDDMANYVRKFLGPEFRVNNYISFDKAKEMLDTYTKEVPNVSTSKGFKKMDLVARNEKDEEKDKGTKKVVTGYKRLDFRT